MITKTTDWNSMNELQFDGRQVMFKTAGGDEYEAPATAPVELNREQRLALFKANDGAFPDYKRWKQVGWREKEPGDDLARGLCPRKI